MKPTDDRREQLEFKLNRLLSAKPISFKGLKKSAIDKGKGVYLISEKDDEEEIALYVGKTKSLPNGICNVRLSKYLIMDNTFENPTEAKNYIQENCFVRWVKVDNSKLRSSLEAYALALIDPEYGHSE